MSLNKHVIAYNNVDEALRLDANGSNELALKQYLTSTSIIVAALLQDAEHKIYPNGKNKNAKKLLTIAKQCLDRIGEIGEILINDDSNLAVNYQSFEKPVQKLDMTLFASNETSSNLLDMSIDAMNLLSFNVDKPITESPLDQVKRENKQLLAAYKARVARTQTMKGKVDLGLALQRRLAENVMLAKAKEKVFAYKQQEVQKRLLEQAARKIGQKDILGCKESENRKLLYTKILQYEHEKQWPRMLKEKLLVNPHNFNQIDLTVRQTLSVTDHPISMALHRQQYIIYDKVIQLISRCPFSVNDFSDQFISAGRGSKSNQFVTEETRKRIKTLFKTRSESLTAENLPDFEMDKDLILDSYNGSPSNEKLKDIILLEEEALQRHLQHIVVDVRSSVDNLLSLMLLTYECLDSPEGRDQCYSSMEESFFKPLWPYLITLFRLAYKTEENTLNEIMIGHSEKTLKDLKVPENYWSNEIVPYKTAIEELKSIITHCCPLKKLDTLVRVAHLMCQDSEDETNEKPMGADDLIPILCFVVLKTKSPQLITECHAMEEFIHECYLMGEEGYCLTTMQTALQYLNSLLPVKQP